METQLHATTGITHLDVLLERLIALCEQSFPARIRSYYLGGSNSDGTAVSHEQSSIPSDVDLFVIFWGTMTEDESATFQHLIAECQPSSPLQVDAHAFSEDDVLRTLKPQMSFLDVLIQEASLLLYGNDMRADLPPVPFSQYILDVIENGIFFLGLPRQRESLAYPLVAPLVFPLSYPDSTGEFYGYDAILAHPGTPRSTRVLVGLTAWIATFLLALETGHTAGQKSQSLRLCKEYLPHDRRVQLAVTINELCKGTWGYALPDRIEDREQLRGLCQETLSLENEYLQLTHDHLLAQLRHGDIQGKRMATRILQSVVYQDDEMIAAVNSWQDLERA